MGRRNGLDPDSYKKLEEFSKTVEGIAEDLEAKLGPAGQFSIIASVIRVDDEHIGFNVRAKKHSPTAPVPDIVPDIVPEIDRYILSLDWETALAEEDARREAA